MPKTILNHQSGTVLAKCEETNEFLLGQYDPGYPGKNKHWIGRIKLLGGNYFAGKDNDESPFGTYTREISEELSGSKAAETEMSASQEHNFASQDEIKLLRDSLIQAEPFQDFFLYHGSEGVHVIQSVFYVPIEKDLMNMVKENIEKGKSLTNEGFLAVKSLDELLAGKNGSFQHPMAQGVTGLIIGHTEGKTLPYCFNDCFTIAPIGKPRNSYKDYLDNFEYRNHGK